MLTLLECMKNNLPSNDSSKFKTTESHMDWEKVAFKDFSGDMCKLKWVEISNEVTDDTRPSPFLTHRSTHIHTDPRLNLPGVGDETEICKQEGRDRVHLGRWYSRQHWPSVLRSTSVSGFVALNTYHLGASVS